MKTIDSAEKIQQFYYTPPEICQAAVWLFVIFLYLKKNSVSKETSGSNKTAPEAISEAVKKNTINAADFYTHRKKNSAIGKNNARLWNRTKDPKRVMLVL